MTLSSDVGGWHNNFKGLLVFLDAIPAFAVFSFQPLPSGHTDKGNPRGTDATVQIKDQGSSLQFKVLYQLVPLHSSNLISFYS